MTCSTLRFTSSRSTGASFMKFGRAPTTERTRMRSLVNVCGDQDRGGNSRQDPEDPERGLAVVPLGHDDLIARAQPPPVPCPAPRDRLLQTPALHAFPAH